MVSDHSIFVNFNPHVPVLAAEGAFLPDGRFVTLPAVPASMPPADFATRVKQDAERYRKIVQMVGLEVQ